MRALTSLAAQPADPILGLIGRFRADPRSDKLDLGVGVYRNAEGQTPVLQSVKRAEEILLSTQSTKAYLAPEGDATFARLLAEMLVQDVDQTERMAAIQTPGGSGALKIAADLLARANPGCTIFIGEPTWPNHVPLLGSRDVNFSFFAGFDRASQEVLFANYLAAAESAKLGDALVLQGGCHNPTGADFKPDQWSEIASVLSRNGAIALIDMAYHGWGQGLAEDAACLNNVLAENGTVLLTYSCDKNFGIYRERVGALFAFGADPDNAQVIFSNMLTSARTTWSMPPDHGAAIVRIILEDAELEALWRSEVSDTRQRLVTMRAALAERSPLLEFLRRQNGLFSLLPLTPQDVDELRTESGIYLPASGRLNVAGLSDATLDVFVDAITPLLARSKQIA